jgi:hypothetical protein
VITSMPDDGDRDSLWDIAHELQDDMADPLRRLHYKQRA